MAYNDNLANKIRVALSGTENLVEKKMFGGIAFMVNDKMCIGVNQDDIMLRCEGDKTDELLSKKGARIFNLTGKPMKGWLLVNIDSLVEDSDFEFWLNIAMDANKNLIISPAKKKSK